MKARFLVSLVALAALLALSAWLARLQAGGPPHAALVLEGDVPALLTVPARPDAARSDRGLPDPPPRGERPPAVVLAHGYGSDRANMSIMARSLASAGYAVLTLDLRGHGANRNPFPSGSARDDALIADLAAGVDFLRLSPYVDGERIAVGGHSLGAGASIAYATRDAAIDGLLLISGGLRASGPHRPPNALFLYAELDPARLQERAGLLAGLLAGVDVAEPGRTYGAFAQGTAVRRVQIAGVDQATIVASPAAIREIVAWLDAIYGREGSAWVPDPRPRVAVLGLVAFLLVLPGVGEVVGRLAPKDAERGSRGAALGLAILATGLLATLPLFAGEPSGALLSIEVAEIVVPHLGLAGLSVLVALVLARRLSASDLLAGFWSTAGAAAVGIVAIYFLLAPFAAVFHRLTLTPERAAIALAMAALLLPFALAHHTLFWRGGTAGSLLRSLAGRIVVVSVLVVGVLSGVTTGAVMFMIPALAILFVLVDVSSAAIYATSRNVLASAMIESLWIAWIFAAVLPVRL